MREGREGDQRTVDGIADLGMRRLENEKIRELGYWHKWLTAYGLPFDDFYDLNDFNGFNDLNERI